MVRRSWMVLTFLLALATAAAAQAPPPTGAEPKPAPPGRGGRANGGQPANDRVSLAELQRLFDAYFVLQAQEALRLDDSQFAPFLTRLKALQDTRRRNEVARVQLVGEIGKAFAPGSTPDEVWLKDKLRALQELDSRAAAELRKAYEALDQVLDVPRQARFRVFEQNMERRKFELLVRARRAEAGRQEPGRQP
jgi:hypothetical protein